MTLPDTFVVGAGRCGTTALHQLLAQHPEVHVGARKSPNHFATGIPQPSWETPVAIAMARDWVADRADYEALFTPTPQTRAVVDVSPVYLQALAVPRRIHEARPDARIIAIVRDPAERAVSHFLGRQRDGIEPATVSLDERIGSELAGPLPNEVAFGHYVGCGRYHHFLSPYVELFGRQRVLVLFHDDLLIDPDGTLDSVFAFLDVRRDVSIDADARPNRTGHIRSPLRRWVWTRSVGVRTALRPHLPAALRRRVGQRFLDDVERPTTPASLLAAIASALATDTSRLADLTGRDLSAWRHGIDH